MSQELNDRYIVVTGAAGFIGSCMVAFLNAKGSTNLVLVDDFSVPAKAPNLSEKSYALKVNRMQFEQWLSDNGSKVEAIYHLGAKTDTTLQDEEIFKTLNIQYSQMVWDYCVKFQIPLVFASSAATYGDGTLGYKDDLEIISQLQPLNPYGVSKNEFDKWLLKQTTFPPKWYGLKFFNVYGPNEYHKGRMASVIFHAFNQIQQDGKVKLFKSHHPNYSDGGQLRDFIYVKDVVATCFWLMNNNAKSSIYNLGTGKARTFNDLVNALFSALDTEAKIEYIDTPLDIRDSYQYYTQADMTKIQSEGYDLDFYTLEDGVKDYIQQYLSEKKVW
jgi:ADP-L-glycero-D-manno-heptose 6-epimerase